MVSLHSVGVWHDANHQIGGESLQSVTSHSCTYRIPLWIPFEAPQHHRSTSQGVLVPRHNVDVRKAVHLKSALLEF